MSNPASTFFKGILTLLEKEIASLAPDELAAIKPSVVDFFTWVQDNPGSVTNPAIFMPKLLVLKAQIFAAQSTVSNEEIVGFAQGIISLFDQVTATPVPIQVAAQSTSKPV